MRGVRRTLKDAGLDLVSDLTPESPVSRGETARVLERLMDAGDLPSAIVCYNDAVALGVLDAMHRRGIEPGRTVCVVGFDDIDEAAIAVPPLTTVAIRPRDLGREATRMLMERIKNPDLKPQTRLLKGTLIVRDTTGRPRSRRARR
jgi:LacI family transcriptional regulator